MNNDFTTVGYQSLLTAPDIALDTETKDPNLLTMGPGCYRKDGHILGVSLASDTFSTYLPLGHYDTSSEEREANERFISEVFNRTDCSFITANGMYDLDWLQCSEAFSHLNIYRSNRFKDVQYQAPLLDEYRYSYSLDRLAEHYGEVLKKKDEPLRYAEQQGFKFKDVREVLWRMPQDVVREYAAYDAELTLKVYRHQVKEIEEQGLTRIADIEHGLIPILLRMRKVGVRMDLLKLSQVSLDVAENHYRLLQEIRAYAGDSEFNPKSTAHVARILDRDGIAYPHKPPTEKMREKGETQGNANIDKIFLAGIAKEYGFAKMILLWRHCDTMTNTFLLPYNHLRVGDRMHCQFHPLRTDERGTVSGRFSCSYPNLQQVPSRDGIDGVGESILPGSVMRSLFLPEKGCLFGCADYSQEEWRVLAHYAVGPGADELRAEYHANPRMDVHTRLSEKKNLPRRDAKTLNFSLVYGMGAKTFAERQHKDMEIAELFIEQFYSANPFMRPTRKKVTDTLMQRGYIYTLLGRRARRHPSRKDHSFLNRLIQGSCGDIIKKAMVDCWQEGLFDILYPHLVVHDEIDVSVPDTKEGREAFERMTYIMEHATELRVPLLADAHLGANWGEAKG